jgi:hypothetical protein
MPVRKAYRILAVLVAVALTVQQMALGSFIHGLHSWMLGDGGMADPGAMRSSDPEFDGSYGILDKLLLRSAEQWLDAGIGLTIHRVIGTVVVPALALLLVVVAGLARSRPMLLRAVAVLLVGVVRALLGRLDGEPPVVDALSELALLGMVAATLAALGRIRGLAPAPDKGRPPRRPGNGVGARWTFRVLAAAVALAAAAQAVGLALYIGGLHRFLTTGRGGTLWLDILDRAVSPAELRGFYVVLVTLVALPVLALILWIVAFLTRVPAAPRLAAAILVATVLQPFLFAADPSVAGGGFALGMLGAFAAAWYLATRLVVHPPAPTGPDGDARPARTVANPDAH